MFTAISTQWRVGPTGAYGLDYLVMYAKMDRLGLAPDAYEELESEIRTLEDAALEVMRKARDK